MVSFRKYGGSTLSQSFWKTSVVLFFYEKADKKECKNHGGISLIDIAVKIVWIILLNGFKGAREKNNRENQSSFFLVEAVQDIFCAPPHYLLVLKVVCGGDLFI